MHSKLWRLASQITGNSTVSSTTSPDEQQRNHQSYALQSIWPVDSPDKWPSNVERVSMSWRRHERKKYRPMVRLCQKMIISIRNILWGSQEVPYYLHYSNSGGYSNGVMIKKAERKGQTKINALSIGMILRIKGIWITGPLKDSVKSRWLSMTFPNYMCYRHISGGLKRRKVY